MDHFVRRHRDRLQVLAGVALGVAVAAVALVADSAVELPMQIPTTNALSLLAATFSALVTAGAFAFWMLPLAAQLAASAVPPTIVAGRLHGRFQRRVITVTLGALAYTAVAAAAVPSSEDGSAPTITTALGATLGVAAIAALLVAIEHAVRSTRPSVLVSEVAHGVIDSIRAAGRSAAEQDVDASPASGSSTASVVAPATGWLHAVDEDALLGAVPEGTTVSLQVGLGAFLVEGWTTVATVRGPDIGEEVGGRLEPHFVVDIERSADQALVGQLTQFTDIAVHAGSGSSGAPSVVYETIWYLGAILHELVQHRLGRTARRTDDGRVLEWSPDPDAATLANVATDRIRQVTAAEPAMALELVRVLVDVRRAACRAGRDELVDVLDDQADLIVEQCRRADPLPNDLERVVAARRGGRHADRTAERDEEYVTA
ncbi:DUF2254 domain-containing protein [Acidimicrobiia bacterium EGI L10123]|uniref:DUF2254 family protein n=1 Tax=Salinilacustrithrix flava TaxID=2957203 RepID=UPI003D7C20D4|nr:DUF2254 domain-containing protein [Acidimicrobiia bacterium EGI L10123]